MNLDLQKNKFHALDEWFWTPQGRFLQESISIQMLKFKDRLRGTSMLQLGLCGDNVWLKDLPFRRQWLLTPCINESRASIISSVNELPFDRGSVDCIIAPFTLELNLPDKRIFCELDRVLRPMGHVIFIGVNPFSLWGLFLKLGLIEPLNSFNIRLTSSLTLKQLMLNQGYRLNALETFCYVPPVSSAIALSRLRFLNEMGKMVILSPAGFYCLVVQKCQYAMPKLVAQKKSQKIKIREAAAGLARI